jgi:TIR domain-containing protein
VSLDQWEAVPGDQLPAYMERSIRENQFVLIVCTPRYKAKSDERSGGVGYEGDIMTAEVYSKSNHRKFIPIWRNGTWRSAAPSWLAGKYYVDLRGDPYSETHYIDLLSTLHGTRVTAPPLGAPFSTTGTPARPTNPPRVSNPSPKEPLRIVGVIVDEVTQPRMDGTRGSALYAVPFRLSSRPDSMWSQLFVQNWDRPPRWTSMHRPGIAHVSGDRIVLDGTTLEEIEKYHRETLKLALAETNRQYGELVEQQRREAEAQRAREEEHRKDIEERAKRLKFD